MKSLSLPLKSAVSNAPERMRFAERSDRKWVFASASRAAEYFVLEDKEQQYTNHLKSLCDHTWDLETFENNKVRKV